MTTKAPDPSDGTWIAEGETWFADIGALCQRYNIVCLSQDEGDVFAGVPGKGFVSLASLLEADGKPETAKAGDNITTIKPASRRTD